MEALILTKGDIQLIVTIGTIPLAFAETYGWNVEERIVDENTIFNQYSEIN
jgi:hypothetical protein